MAEAAAQTELEGRDLTNLERTCAIQQLALRHGWHRPNGINSLLTQTFCESLYSKALPSPLHFTDEEWRKVLKNGIHRDYNASGMLELESMVKDHLWSTLGFPLRIIDGGDYGGPDIDRTTTPHTWHFRYPRNYDLRIPVSAQQPELSEVTIGDVLDRVWREHFAGVIPRHDLVLKPLGDPRLGRNPLQINFLRFRHFLQSNERDDAVEPWYESEPLSTLLEDATGLGQVLQLCRVA
eukprot:s3407_g3.t1